MSNRPDATELLKMPPSQPRTEQPEQDGSRRFRLGPLKVFLLLLLLALTWAVAMVVYVPAGWIWHQARDVVTLPPEMEVHAVSGSVWAGDVQVSHSGLPVRVSWQLDVRPLIHGFVPLELDMVAPHSRAEGSITGMLDGQVRVLLRQAEVNLDGITRTRALEGVSVGGIMELESFFVVWSPDEGWLDARGYGHWPGGTVTWPMGGRTERATLPPLEGDLRLDRQNLILDIADQESGQTGVTATLEESGYVDVSLRKHWVDLLGLDFAPDAEPDDVLFNMRRRLF